MSANTPQDSPADPPLVVRWRDARVIGERREWGGAVEYDVRILDPDGSDRPARALAYPQLVGRPQAGDRVLLNTSALDRGLGTGGYAMVVAIPDRLPPDPPAGPGHLVKARYTPLQPMLLGVDDQESPHHELLAAADSLDGLPVIVADLHSALPAILAGLRERAPGARVVYLMSDGGALPVWFSRAVAGLREAGVLAGTVSTGQAFGGDLEAVTVHSGLLAARHVLGADVVVLTQGPGNLGTGTGWGFSGVAAGEAVNATATLGGRPIASLRVSGADARARHRGISHHSLTAYGRVALVPADVVVPDLSGVDAELDALVQTQAGTLAQTQADALDQTRDGALARGRHRLVRVGVEGLMAALRGCPVGLSTMGRGLDADPASFLAVAAAGRHVAAILG